MEEERLTKEQKKILKTGAIIAAAMLALLLIVGVFIPMAMRSYFKLAYQDRIAYYAEQNDLDPYFVSALIFCESKFNPDAVSRAGARGLMQVMPATGAEIAELLHEAYEEDMLFDPETSIRFGTYYLHLQMERFDHNPAIVLAAYNAGPHRAEQWISEYGLDSNQHIRYIPFKETDGYVKKVLAVQEVYKILYRDVFSPKA